MGHFDAIDLVLVSRLSQEFCFDRNVAWSQMAVISDFSPELFLLEINVAFGEICKSINVDAEHQYWVECLNYLCNGFAQMFYLALECPFTSELEYLLFSRDLSSFSFAIMVEFLLGEFLQDDRIVWAKHAIGLADEVQ